MECFEILNEEDRVKVKKLLDENNIKYTQNSSYYLACIDESRSRLNEILSDEGIEEEEINKIIPKYIDDLAEILSENFTDDDWIYNKSNEFAVSRGLVKEEE